MCLCRFSKGGSAGQFDRNRRFVAKPGAPPFAAFAKGRAVGQFDRTPSIETGPLVASSFRTFFASRRAGKMKPPLNLILFLAAALVVALLADAWRSARRDSQQLAATLAAQNQVIQQAADREKQRDTQLAAALAAIQSQKQTVKTPQQAAQAIPSVLPPLPVSINEPNLSGPLAPGEIPTTTISVPQPDLIPLYDNLQDCRATALQTAALQKDLSDEKTRSASLERERDAAKTAARGGSVLQRMKRAAKWFLIGAAAGAAAAALRH